MTCVVETKTQVETRLVLVCNEVANTKYNLGQ
jgi:hypothetical protein